MAFYGMEPAEMIRLSKLEKFSLEFSSALTHRSDMESLFNEYPYPKLVHNYFPAPAIPFVLNLASGDPMVRIQSMEHVLKGLRWSKQAGAGFYCAHAGFCVDPKPEDLGKKFTQSTERIDREKYWRLFLESVTTILTMAEALEIDFYIENNVTAKMNLNIHGASPLLCSDAEEMERLIQEINHPRLGILLDTAHLKVSANTLNFSAVAAVKKIAPHVRAIHHSDNEGALDNNQPIEPGYWFGQFMPDFSNIPHVLEVKKQEISAIKKQMALLKNAQQTGAV